MSVDKTASQDDIKKSYRKLARKFHPDVSKEKDAESRFKDINEAYEVLRDKEKRAAYDQLGNNWQGEQSGFHHHRIGKSNFTKAMVILMPVDKVISVTFLNHYLAVASTLINSHHARVSRISDQGKTVTQK